MGKGHENVIGKGFDANPQNINLAGKPKGARNRATIYREHLEKQGKLGQVVDDVVLAIIDKALTGDTNAAKEAMDSAYGKNADKIQEVAPEPDKDLTDAFLESQTLEQLEALKLKAATRNSIDNK